MGLFGPFVGNGQSAGKAQRVADSETASARLRW